MDWKPTLAVALVIAATLQCVQAQPPTSIQFSFDTTNLPTGDEAVALSNGGTQQIFLPIVVSIEPSIALLQSDIIVMVTVTGGTATSGTDFVLVRNQVTFDIGANNGNTISVPINIMDDPDVEGTETFTLTGSVVTTGTIAIFVGGPVIISILDNDVQIGWQLTSYQAAEGIPTVTACATVNLGAAGIGTNTVTLSVLAIAGTALGGGTDYGTPNPNVFTFTASQTTQCTNVPITDDMQIEGVETFDLVLAPVTGVLLSPGTATVSIADNDVQIGWEATTYMGAEGGPPVTACATVMAGASNIGSRSINIQITSNPITATAGVDYRPPMPNSFVFTTAQTRLCTNIEIVDDQDVEGDVDETFNIVLSQAAVPPDPSVQISPAVATVSIDDNDMPNPCDPNPCDPNAMCEVTMASFTCTCTPPFVGDGMTCMRPVTMGDDPHFSIVLPGGKLLCYTVQGEHGFSFNLITSKRLTMNAMFVPDSRRKEVTWLGSIGVVVANTQYQGSNMTKLKFDVDTKEVHIGEKVTLKAKKIEALTFHRGKLSISEAPPKKGFRYPAVKVNLNDVGLSFTIKFTGNHLDMFWHSVGEQREDSHGLIGQFFRKGVGVDTVRKLLILPGKEPVPVMRRPVWSFMEREVVDDQLCWTAMNPGYQGEGLIDGTYFDYLVDDVLSTDFQFKPKGRSYRNGDADKQ